jgi:hypothetical protein
VTLSFVYLSPFVADARRLGFVDEDLQELEVMLLERPDAGAMVAGTGGVRKIRFSPSRWRRGKSGATRIIYAYMPTAEQVYLVLAYGKDEQANLTPDQKALCRAYVSGIKKYLETGW